MIDRVAFDSWFCPGECGRGKTHPSKRQLLASMSVAEQYWPLNFLLIKL